MEAVNSCEPCDNICQSTGRNNPEDSYLHIHRRENLNITKKNKYVCNYVEKTMKLRENGARRRNLQH
jgi:hypothetical protein